MLYFNFSEIFLYYNICLFIWRQHFYSKFGFDIWTFVVWQHLAVKSKVPYIFVLCLESANSKWLLHSYCSWKVFVLREHISTRAVDLNGVFVVPELQTSDIFATRRKLSFKLKLHVNENFYVNNNFLFCILLHVLVYFHPSIYSQTCSTN